MSVVPLVEGLVLGALLFVAATRAYRPSPRAHRFLRAVYWIAVADAALWIVGMCALVIWMRPDFAGSEVEGPLEVVAVLAATLRVAWCAAKIALCVWARRRLGNPETEAWIERVEAVEPTRS